MEKKIFILSVYALCGLLFALPHAWINEIHYDNIGTDINEFVEVVVEDPESVYLGDLALYMYNGYDGTIYCLDTVDEFEIGERVGAFQYYVWYQRGIQNETEGMILVFKDTLVDIIAYEGSFTGVDEPAAGLLFPDVGVRETTYGPDTNSIYLTGMPGSAWTYGPATPGALNIGQQLSEAECPVELGYFKAKYVDGKLNILWRTESETENLGFNLYRNGSLLCFTEGAGTISSAREYAYCDHLLISGYTYTYVLSQIDHSGTETFLDTLRVKTPLSRKFTVSNPFPNPCNPVSNLRLEVHFRTDISIDLIDLGGRRLMRLFDGELQPGVYDYTLNMQNLASGRYWLRCASGNAVETVPVLLLK